MTLGRSAGGGFSDGAEAYAATMAPSVRVMAERVVARAALGPGEAVLDVGTGTGTAAGLARGGGRRIVGVDLAPGMLAIARRELPELSWVEAAFEAMPFDDATFDVVLAVHALLFAADPVAALSEWRRVTRPGGRLSLSVPGPAEVVPASILRPVFERHGIRRETEYPGPGELAAWASAAGWDAVDGEADPTTAIVLDDEAAYQTWLSVGARGRATDWDEARRDALVRDLAAVTPRDSAGRFRLPFGTLYLTARKAGA